MHMQPHQLQVVLLDRSQRQRQIAIPDAVLAVFAAGVGFLTVAVTKSGIDAQPDFMAW